MLSTVQRCFHCCQHDEISVHKVSMVTYITGMTSIRFAKLLDAKTIKGPKVIMSYQKLSRGTKHKWKVMENQIWFGSVVGLIKKLVCSVGMVKFHVGSFLGILMDFGEVKNLDEIGFMQVKLQANDDESEDKI